MSSFRRRTAVQPIPGTRPSPYNAAPLLSTGLTSLDDLLGGGLPLSTSLLIESDSPTSYAELLLRYWIAQGLECGQEVIVVASGLDGGPRAVVDALMEVDGGRPVADSSSSSSSTAGMSRQDVQEDEEEKRQEENLKEQMKIAFRYEGLRQHQTTIESSTSNSSSTGTYCSVFDLTQTRRLSEADRSLLHLIDVDELCSSSASPNPYEDLYNRIESLVQERGARISSDPSVPRRAIRIALSGFGGPSCGPAPSPALFAFVHRLRHLLRQAHVSCIMTFPAYLYATQSGQGSSAPLSPLLTRLSHAADGVLRLSTFAASPTLSATFPRHAGLISFPKLPTLPPGSLVPPGSKLSVLRGLGGGGEGRENLIGFRVKRRRFVVEVVSDDPVAGGTGEDEQKEKRRKRVEEANRKEREMAGGKSGMEVLLGLPSRMAQVRIGGEEEEEGGGAESAAQLPPPVPSSADQPSTAAGAVAQEPVSFRPARKKGVRLGGVQFQSDEGRRAEAPRPPAKKVSVARMVHETPDLLDF
ncbi:hypothetical protein C6P46_001853 [Rhodotorula mucilaginosa]|uniref:Elongator complex protein 4 n=1 Tax=Rhodotorula mucilaginosa TaxID=5537 RepID=A0A9P7B212_RHOMI|nr:hypothetical protein C6P46_001853 [Rhodotorula mucilaginosa]TKA50176.1 hypothetical protein B0A53_06407 [Rhodotorula sp. CCFEE 5036]